MHLSMLAGTTSKIIQIPVYDSSSTVGANLAGLAFNTTSLVCWYSREGAAGAANQITLLTATKGTWTTAGFVAVDGTNMPGWYELHVPNAAIATGAKSVSIQLHGAANMVPVNILIELTAVDNQDAVRMALTSLPNAAAAASGGLPTVDATNSVKVQTPLKKNTAISNFTFQMFDSTGTLKTGLTVTTTVKIDSGAFGAATNAVTEIANGWYVISLAAADVNGNVISLRFTATGAADTDIVLLMQP